VRWFNGHATRYPICEDARAIDHVICLFSLFLSRSVLPINDDVVLNVAVGFLLQPVQNFVLAAATQNDTQ
jgi:hypothetical protein